MSQELCNNGGPRGYTNPNTMGYWNKIVSDGYADKNIFHCIIYCFYCFAYNKNQIYYV